MTMAKKTLKKASKIEKTNAPVVVANWHRK